jgi:hypothetical protein
VNLLLTFATALIAGLVIDLIAFRGELTGFVRDEVVLVAARFRRRHVNAQEVRPTAARRFGQAR